MEGQGQTDMRFVTNDFEGVLVYPGCSNQSTHGKFIPYDTPAKRAPRLPIPIVAAGLHPGLPQVMRSPIDDMRYLLSMSDMKHPSLHIF